jgi:hypothetical protein
VRFDLAKEREGGAAGGGLVLGRGRGESIGMEAADVVESDVGADVVERGGDDSLELCHVECVTATGRRHVEERLSLRSLSSSLNTNSSQIPFLPHFGYPLTPIAGLISVIFILSHPVHRTTLFISLLGQIPSLFHEYVLLYLSWSPLALPYALNLSQTLTGLILPKKAKF